MTAGRQPSFDGSGGRSRDRRSAKARRRHRVDAQHMTDADVERAVRLLDEWPRGRRGRLSWDRLKSALEESGRTWSRQTLDAKPEIARAFQTAKKKLRNGRDPAPASAQPDEEAIPPIDPAIELLQRKIAGLEAEIVRLTAALGRYDERFIRYQRNAQLRGMTIDELNRPLPPSPDDSGTPEGSSP